MLFTCFGLSATSISFPVESVIRLPPPSLGRQLTTECGFSSISCSFAFMPATAIISRSFARVILRAHPLLTKHLTAPREFLALPLSPRLHLRKWIAAPQIVRQDSLNEHATRQHLSSHRLQLRMRFCAGTARTAGAGR